MNQGSENPLYYACPCCAFPMAVPKNCSHALDCERCGHVTNVFKPKSIQATLIFSLTSLILFIPALYFPFMTFEFYGNRNSSTIWGGVKTLINDGSWAIGLIVLFASIVIPLLKLVILFYLALTSQNSYNAKFKTRLYHIIEALGRWSMLDIFLLAVLVAIMKIGMTRVEPEVGSLLFALVVIFTMIASASFNPQLLWKEQYGNIESKSENTKKD